jgi:Zn-finger nucleic acid-binding protein
MTTRTVGAGSAVILIDVCATGCAGIWLDTQDMRMGLDVTDDLQQLPVTPCYIPDTRQPAPCPICRTAMQRYRWNYQSTVTLDQCSAGHGTWIDGGEVQAMEEFEEHELLPPEKQARLRAQLGIDQLELQTNHHRRVGGSPSHMLNLMDMVWNRFL